MQLNDDSDVAQLNSLQAAADLAATVSDSATRLQFAAQAISQAQVDADTADLKSKRALVGAAKGAGGRRRPSARRFPANWASPPSIRGNT